MEVSMNALRILALVILLTGSSVGWAGSDAASPPKELTLENLMQQALDDDFMPGGEIIVSYVEIPPRTTLDRHWHPGEEFHYYLDGKVEILIDGEPSITGTPGGVGHVPYKKTHTAVTGDEGARILVFRVHTKGEPVRYLEEGGESDH
jgi:quercetin dioxygenase-like cupin family protein